MGINFPLVPEVPLFCFGPEIRFDKWPPPELTIQSRRIAIYYRLREFLSQPTDPSNIMFTTTTAERILKNRIFDHL